MKKTIVRMGLVNVAGQHFGTVADLLKFGNVSQAIQETEQDIRESRARGDKEQEKLQKYKLSIIKGLKEKMAF